MKPAENNSNQQEEYREFLTKLRKEREGASNFAKLLFTIILAVLMAVIVVVIVVENSSILNRLSVENVENSGGLFKFSRRNKGFDVPFGHRRQNILLLGVDSNG